MFTISLKAARVNADLKQSEAAELIGVSVKTLQNYEKGINPIPAYTLRKAAEIYGVEESIIRLPERVEK